MCYFGRVWVHRVAGIEALALKMAGGKAVVQAEATKARAKKTAAGGASGAAGGVSAGTATQMSVHNWSDIWISVGISVAIFAGILFLLHIVRVQNARLAALQGAIGK